MNIFVGNLSFSSTDASLSALFEPFGTVTSAKVILDPQTKRSRGFGFVEMPDEAEAKAAIAGADGKDLDGRKIRVSEGQPRKDLGGAPRQDR